MNMVQIRYFIAVAKCLSFSEAADELYISQPSLSRQIASIEKEISCPLFIRSSRGLQLTPAGMMLLEEFGQMSDIYYKAIAKAIKSREGISGALRIGVLDGAVVGDIFADALNYFSEYHPNIDIQMHTYDYKEVVERLYDGRLDLAITLYFEISRRKNLKFRIIEKTHDHLVVHKSHPLAIAGKVKLSDFKADTFIMVNPDNSERTHATIVDACIRQGFIPKIKFTPSLLSQMLWVQSGMGVCVFDTRNVLITNPVVKFLEIDPIDDPSLTLVWHQDNKNSARELFEDALFTGRPPI